MLIDPRHKLRETQLRWFAALWLPAFCLIVGMTLSRRGARVEALALVALALLIAAIGTIRPNAVRPLYTGLMWITFPIAWVVSHVLLRAIYYGVITPVGFVIRFFLDPLERAFDGRAATYWSPREPSKPDRYFRQF